MTLNEQIKNYLLSNHIDRNTQNPYDETAKKFSVDKEVIRGVWRKLRRAGLVEQNVVHSEVKRAYVMDDGVINSEFSVKGDNAQVTTKTSNEVKTLEDLVKVCNIDTNEWNVAEWKCKKWDLGIKGEGKEIITEQLFSVSAVLKKKKLDTDLTKQKEVLLQELKAKLLEVPVAKYSSPKYRLDKKLLLELALFDVHFGKLSHEDESGEDYDLKIASDRYKAAITNLLSKVDLTSVGKILLPIGNDLFNIDNINKTTTNFTPQDNDTRFHKMVKIVKNLLIETIDFLSTVAPVDVVMVVGNHDTTVTFLLGEILDAYYNSNPNISIDNTTTLRKYYRFGVSSFLMTHGDREKQADLGMIFAAENPKLWADTEQRFIQIGHYHHNKKINYLSMNEFQGFQVQILPSLSPNDAWHTGKGYSALRQAKAFLFDESEGLVGELTYTAKK